MLHRCQMDRVRQAKDPEEHKHEKEKGNEGRLDFNSLNGAGKPLARLIRKQTADQAENKSAQQRRAKGMK
jgi:hypothetical protein